MKFIYLWRNPAKSTVWLFYRRTLYNIVKS